MTRTCDLDLDLVSLDEAERFYDRRRQPEC
jgi:hypothetical protein